MKFRPVVDAKRWVTRGYATMIMWMLKKFVKKVYEKSGKVLSESKVPNGWGFAAQLKEMEAKDGYNVVVSADICEAYTNVTEAMINKAVSYVGELIGAENWEIDLMTKLVTLILSNNYVETSSGIYLFGKVLPMGYRISADALDLVALTGENFAASTPLYLR